MVSWDGLVDRHAVLHASRKKKLGLARTKNLIVRAYYGIYRVTSFQFARTLFLRRTYVVTCRSESCRRHVCKGSGHWSRSVLVLSRIHRFRGIKNLRLIDFLWDNSQSWMSTESQRTITSRSEPSRVAANSDILMWESRSSWFDRLLLSAVRESWVQVPYIRRSLAGWSETDWRQCGFRWVSLGFVHENVGAELGWW